MLAVFRAGTPTAQEGLFQIIRSDHTILQLTTYVDHIRHTDPAVEAAFVFLQPAMDSFLTQSISEELLRGVSEEENNDVNGRIEETR